MFGDIFRLQCLSWVNIWLLEFAVWARVSRGQCRGPRCCSSTVLLHTACSSDDLASQPEIRGSTIVLTSEQSQRCQHSDCPSPV